MTQPEDFTPEAEEDAITRLDNADTKQLLERAHKALIKRLLVRIESGTATKDDIAQLRQLLKDNGMVYVVPPPGGDAPGPSEPMDLPDYPDPDYPT